MLRRLSTFAQSGNEEHKWEDERIPAAKGHFALANDLIRSLIFGWGGSGGAII